MPDRSETIERIEDLITAVYRNRTVNPWDDGPTRSIELVSMFRDQFPDWPFFNHTDLVHGASTVLAFLLHPGAYIGVPTRDGVEVRIKRLGGECYQALVEISHLGPYARVRFTHETLDTETGSINYSELPDPFREEDNIFLSQLEGFLSDRGIEILPEEILHRPVPDIQLDVTERGDVTIYHCLFDEE
jgi:hypothetical protein